VTSEHVVTRNEVENVMVFAKTRKP